MSVNEANEKEANHCNRRM